MIYLCTTRPCVVAELSRQAHRQSLSVDDLLPRELWRITVDLTKVLDLTNRDTLQALEVEPRNLIRDDLQYTHEIGETAHAYGYQAIRSASATGLDDVVGIMCDNLGGAVLLAELIQEWTTVVEVH